MARPPLLKRSLSKPRLLALCTFWVVAAVSFVYIIIYHDPSIVLREYLENEISPLLFILLMFILPIFGVPLSIFLVLVGMKFGVMPGIVIAAVTMLLHMGFTYFLVHSFLRDALGNVLKTFQIFAPLTQKTPGRWQAFILMLVPGLPYAVKNYLLALTGMEFVPYLYINWLAQFGLSIPFIVLGRAVIEMNLIVLAVSLGLVLAGFLLQYFVGKRYRAAKINVSERGGKESATKQ